MNFRREKKTIIQLNYLNINLIYGTVLIMFSVYFISAFKIIKVNSNNDDLN